MSDNKLYALLAEIEACGLKVNNLFPLDDGIWQANLRDNNYGHEFGRANDPIEALHACFEKAKASKHIKVQSQ